jgi:phenylacetate-coenzyme A ligase PaaK-like adenylate-forming protein
MSETIDLWAIDPYSLGRSEKNALLTEQLVALSEYHYRACCEYRRMVDAARCDLTQVTDHHDLPFLPVSLFKTMDLISVSQSEVVKTITSSGTTGQAVSKIYLDRTTAANQQRTLSRIVSNFVGGTRMPMLIVDSPSVVSNRAMFSARGAGILGFSIFGSDRAYAMDDAMNLDVAGLEKFLAKYQGRTILLFGFTFMVWQHFYKELLKLRRDTGQLLDLCKGTLIHGGGWKKLLNEAVSPEVFKASLREICGLARVHDYYGLAEQTGCIYMECEMGRLHASVFSDIITRRAADFSPCAFGEKGIIQVLSVLPKSYPGHSLLTEDEGTILGEDDCPCGRKGKYFTITGRLTHAEIRGCSDTYAARF